MQTREEKIGRLEEINCKIYENEDPDTYDIDGAVLYWNKLSDAELDAELADYEARVLNLG